MKCSIIVDFSLLGTPLRRIHSCFRCVVYTVRMSPSHFPVENPCHVCGAHSGGCGRPSIEIVRSCSYVLMYILIAESVCVCGSFSSQMRTCIGPWKIYGPLCTLHWCSRNVRRDASHVSAARRAPSVIGKPV